MLGFWIIWLQDQFDSALERSPKLQRLRGEERGDVVNWLIIVLGVAVAGSAVVLVLRPAIEQAGTTLANYL